MHMLRKLCYQIKRKIQMDKTFISLAKAQELGKKYKLPLYVYSEDIIRQKAKLLLEATNGYHVSYAMKANSNSKILEVLQDSGITHVDVVSPGQIRKALKNGYTPEQILYTENFIDQEEMDYALATGVTLNIGAFDTLKHFREKLSGRKIFIRINPNKGAGENYKVITGGPQSKFGISENQLPEVIKVAQQSGIQIIGLHQHIGSNLKAKDREVFIQTTKFILEKSQLFANIKYVNIGGGIGIKYRPQEQLLDIKQLFSEIKRIRDQINKDLELWIEPGRFLVAECGILLCQITARKQTSEKIFYGTNTGFNHLLRPAFYKSHHHIFNLNQSDREKEISTICGNICECSDNMGVEIPISGKIGDILCIENAGAYGFSMSSNFNERLRPAEVLMRGDEDILIRRRETYEDLDERL